VQRRTALGLVFYVGLGVVLAGILLQVLPAVLPRPVAVRVERNSEGFVMALLVVPWIQWVRPRLAGRRSEWPVTLAFAALCAAVGVLLIATDLPSRFRTLNEGFLAAALLVPYVQPRRPLPRWVPYAVSVAALAVMVLGRRDGEVVDLAEMLAAVVLAPLAFDVVDRRTLDPDARSRDGLRYAWYVFLVALPGIFSVTRGTEVGRYGSRCTEAFLFLLLAEGYLAVYRSMPVRTSTRSYV
jgi:hypothetical protein